MYGFPLSISCCVEISNIPNEFVKYIDVSLFKAVSIWFNYQMGEKMSIKELKFDASIVVPSEDHSLRKSGAKR